MDINLNVATAPKDSTFQLRINSDIKKTLSLSSNGKITYYS